MPVEYLLLQQNVEKKAYSWIQNSLPKFGKNGSHFSTGNASIYMYNSYRVHSTSNTVSLLLVILLDHKSNDANIVEGNISQLGAKNTRLMLVNIYRSLALW